MLNNNYNNYSLYKMKMKFNIKPVYQNSKEAVFGMAVRRPQSTMPLMFTSVNNSAGCSSCGG